MAALLLCLVSIEAATAQGRLDGTGVVRPSCRPVAQTVCLQEVRDPGSLIPRCVRKQKVYRQVCAGDVYKPPVRLN